MTALVWLLIFTMVGVGYLAVALARNTSRIDAVTLPGDDDPVDADCRAADYGACCCRAHSTSCCSIHGVTA